MSQNAWVAKMSEDFQGAMQRWREQVDEEEAGTHLACDSSPSKLGLRPHVNSRRRRSNSLVLLESSSSIHPIASLQQPLSKKQKYEEEGTPSFDVVPRTVPRPSVPCDSVSASQSFSEMPSATSSPKTDNMDAGPADPKLASIRERLGKSLENRILGHMPMDKFLDEFLPKNDGETETDHTARMGSVDRLVDLNRASVENDLYDGLAAAFTELSDNKIIFRVSAKKKDKTTGHRFRPDLMGYATTDGISDEDETRWKAVDLFVEAKLPGRYDGFRKIQFDDLAENPKETRSQIIHYMDSQWKYQHREHGFCVEFLGQTSEVRFLRFDPAGIVVSRSLRLGKEQKHFEDNKLLAEFLYRFGRASKREKGWSSAWEAVNERELDFELIRKSLGCKPEFKITVNNATYYTGPRRSPRFFRSRATVGYHATRWIEKDRAYSSCFIKDTWSYRIKKIPKHPDAPLESHHGRDNVGPGNSAPNNDGDPGSGAASDAKYQLNEGDVYSKLQKKGVGHVPTMIFQHEGSPTFTDEYVNDDWINYKPPPMTKQVHRLLCLEEYAKPIHEFTTVGEMLRAWKDALSAYKEAIEKAHQMHQDINADNVLIKSDGSGLLSDWDQSVGIDKDHAHLHGRTGTVVFMAAALLKDSKSRHCPKHDLESYYHLLAFLIYFYAPNPLNSKQIKTLTALYQLLDEDNPLLTLAAKKLFEIQDGYSIAPNAKLEDGTWGPLGPLLAKLRKEVMQPLVADMPTLTWQEAAEKMIDLAQEALDEQHNDLSKGPRKPEDVALPWDETWVFRKSVAGSKRTRSGSPQAGRGRYKRSRSSQSSEGTLGEEEKDQELEVVMEV